MPNFENPIAWVVALLVATLAYFLKDAHTNIKVGLREKATQKSLDDARMEWRNDLKELEERHQRETSRLEHQYDQKFAAVVVQFQERMDSVERNLQGRMDLILELLKRNQP